MNIEDLYKNFVVCESVNNIIVIKIRSVLSEQLKREMLSIKSNRTGLDLGKALLLLAVSCHQRMLKRNFK